MIIKMLTTSADASGVRSSGREYDVPEKEAIELIERGYAVYTEKSKVDDVIEPDDTDEPESETVTSQPETEKRILKRKKKL